MSCLKKLIFNASLIAGLSLVGQTTADAGFLVRISDGTNSLLVQDNSASDFNSQDGIVVVNHQLSGFNFNMAAGISKPALGGANKPQMHLSSVQFTSADPKTIVIEVTDTDFTGAPGGIDPAMFKSSIGGVTSGSVSYSTYADSNNDEFGHEIQLGPEYTTSGMGGFASNWNHIAGVTAPFSITMQAIITHSGFGITSFDAELRAVPEPSSWVAWIGMMPMIGIVFWYHRRKKSV